MKGLRTQKSFKNFSTSLGYMIVTLLTGLITTPLLLKYLGQTRMGAFRALQDWFGYLTILELGLSGAFRPLLARSVVRSENNETFQIMGAGIRAYFLSALLTLAVGWLVSTHIDRAIPVPDEYRSDLRAATLIFLIQFALIPIGVFKFLLEARQEEYRLHIMLIVQFILTTGLCVALAIQGYGIQGQVIAYLIGMIPLVVYVLWFATRKYPGLWRSLSVSSPSRSVKSSVFKLSRETLVLDISSKISLFTDNILIAYFLGTQWVVPFVITIRLVQIVQGVLQAMGTACWAALAHLHAAGEKSLFNARVTEITELISVVGFAGLVPVAAYNLNFVRLWVGSEQYGGGTVTAIAAANALCLALTSFWGWCFSGTGNIRFLAPSTMLWAIVNLISSLLLVKPLGMVGPLAGTLVSFLAVSLWYIPRQMRRVFGTSARRLFLAVMKPAALGLPLFAVIRWLALAHDPGALFILEMPLVTVAFLVLYWVFMLDRSGKDLWLQIPRKVLAS